MLARHLLELAEKTGLSQSDVARELGISPTLVNFWRLGQREVTPKHRVPLVRIVSRAIHATLQALDANSQQRRAFSREVLALAVLIRAENLQARGVRSKVAAAQVLEELSQGFASQGIAPGTKKYRERMAHLARELSVILEVDNSLEQLRAAVERGENGPDG